MVVRESLGVVHSGNAAGPIRSGSYSSSGRIWIQRPDADTSAPPNEFALRASRQITQRIAGCVSGLRLVYASLAIVSSLFGAHFLRETGAGTSFGAGSSVEMGEGTTYDPSAARGLSLQTPVPEVIASPLPTVTTTRPPITVSPPIRIVIPRLYVDADVVEVGYELRGEDGTTATVWKVADFAAGFHSGSAHPGHPGNTVIAGHNNIRGRVFRHLLDLRLGDEIHLYTAQQQHIYVVSQTLLIRDDGVAEEIRLDNAQWIQPTPDERLTLVSCWPFIKPDHRVVVVAFPVAASQGE